MEPPKKGKARMTVGGRPLAGRGRLLERCPWAVRALPNSMSQATVHGATALGDHTRSSEPGGSIVLALGPVRPVRQAGPTLRIRVRRAPFPVVKYAHRGVRTSRPSWLIHPEAEARLNPPVRRSLPVPQNLAALKMALSPQSCDRRGDHNLSVRRPPARPSLAIRPRRFCFR
jgi:hypothetical protein